MALIEYTVTWDGKEATFLPMVRRFDPDDQITFVTEASNVALQFDANGAFLLPVGSTVYRIAPHSAGEAAPQPLMPAKTIWVKSGETLAPCGAIDSNGKFVAWQGAGFPGTGNDKPAHPGPALPYAQPSQGVAPGVPNGSALNH
ncbi:MAG TPA: hypothetical protein VKG25_04300 [Bryobacteraceae bacterium]|nr:hypothetical protein [Bryobacteraceae bacterium]